MSHLDLKVEILKMESLNILGIHCNVNCLSMSEIAVRKQKNRTESDGMGQCQRLVGQDCFEKSHY